jgi:hypothetical protein
MIMVFIENLLILGGIKLWFELIGVDYREEMPQTDM